MNFQKAENSDYEQIRSIIQQKLDRDYFKYSEENLVKKLLENWYFYTLKVDWQVKWIAGLKFSLKNQNLEILLFASDIKWGGRFMMQEIEKLCKINWIKKIRCRSMADYDAVGFYQKMWFTENFLMKKQFMSRDCWILWKVLD